MLGENPYFELASKSRLWPNGSWEGQSDLDFGDDFASRFDDIVDDGQIGWHVDEHLAIIIEFDERLCPILIDDKSVPDRLFNVIIALDEFCAALIAYPFFFWRNVGCMVDCTAFRADATSAQPEHGKLVVADKIENLIYSDGVVGRQHFRLGNCSRKSVEDETVLTVLLVDPTAQHFQNDMVRSQFATVYVAFDFDADVGLFLDILPEEVTG